MYREVIILIISVVFKLVFIIVMMLSQELKVLIILISKIRICLIQKEEDRIGQVGIEININVEDYCSVVIVDVVVI